MSWHRHHKRLFHNARVLVTPFPVLFLATSKPEPGLPQRPGTGTTNISFKMHMSYSPHSHYFYDSYKIETGLSQAPGTGSTNITFTCPCHTFENLMFYLTIANLSQVCQGDLVQAHKVQPYQIERSGLPQWPGTGTTYIATDYRKNIFMNVYVYFCFSHSLCNHIP